MGIVSETGVALGTKFGLNLRWCLIKIEYFEKYLGYRVVYLLRDDYTVKWHSN